LGTAFFQNFSVEDRDRRNATLVFGRDRRGPDLITGTSVFGRRRTIDDFLLGLFFRKKNQDNFKGQFDLRKMGVPRGLYAPGAPVNPQYRLPLVALGQKKST
jgi:hypothetical protein